MQTILVVDDEFGAVEVLVAALEDEGYRVLSAANGRHGLQCLAENQVDLVITDFMMPLLDGTGMGLAMKADPRTRDIPIIMTSAVTESAVAAKFDGYSAFLRKPFNVDRLLNLVRSLLATRARQAEER